MTRRTTRKKTAPTVTESPATLHDQVPDMNEQPDTQNDQHQDADTQNAAPQNITLDDLQDHAQPASKPTPDPVPEEEPAQPLSEAQMLGLLGLVTSLGLPPEAATAYQSELLRNPLLQMFLPTLELPQLLAKYGIGGGAGGPMPDWLRGLLGAGLIGYVVFTTRSQYATRPERQKDAIPDPGFDFAADSVPSGFAANIPAV